MRGVVIAAEFASGLLEQLGMGHIRRPRTRFLHGATLADKFIFADEAGCFTFNRAQNVSRYFILCTITTSDCSLVPALHELRRKLVWDGASLNDYFHATEDKQATRDAVFEALLQHEFRIQATILEKSKAQPQVRASKARFYKYPWFYHFKHAICKHVDENDRLLVTAASIGNRKEKLTFSNALSDVMAQTLHDGSWAIDFRPAATDPCIQAADYCAWAIQRKWETGKDQAYNLIKDRITYEYDLWKRGTTHFY